MRAASGPRGRFYHFHGLFFIFEIHCPFNLTPTSTGAESKADRSARCGSTCESAQEFAAYVRLPTPHFLSHDPSSQNNSHTMALMHGEINLNQWR